MNVAIVILKNGIHLISQTDQLDYEPKVHLVNPCTISGKTKLTLTSWPEFTEEEHILLRSDDLLTACEPTKKAFDAYLKAIGKTEEELTTKPEPVIMNEEFDPGVPDDEDYDPRYIEE